MREAQGNQGGEMINKKVVLVLGAGASKPFGFPTGGELRAQICQLADGQDSAPKQLLEDVLRWPPQHYQEMCRSFRDSGLPSIDAFLGRRPEFEKIGKYVIACCIGLAENSEKLRHVDNVAGNLDWFGALWSAMMNGVNSIEELQKNTISFITFNYDRSLEVLLHSAIRETFGLDDSRTKDVAGCFPIHHVYGSLGEYLNPEHLHFGLTERRPDDTHYFLEQAARRLKVVTTARGTETDRKAMSMFEGAGVVGFLGFGFDEMNCQRLAAGPALQKGRVLVDLPQLYATTLGLYGAEISRAVKRLLGGTSLEARLNVQNESCLNSLRNWLPFYS